jgi:ribosomal protein S18 acetylase RimI-like enzyme
MRIDVRREDHLTLDSYAATSTAFEVREIVDVDALRSDVRDLPTRAAASPWIKDYDALPGNDPATWASKFDLGRCVILTAYIKDVQVGGAVVIVDPGDAARLGGPASFALIWDLRVAPIARRRGAGRALLVEAEAAAESIGLLGVEVETQDINVPACRLYAAAGYQLREVTPAAYGDMPSEVKLVWEKRVAARTQPH